MYITIDSNQKYTNDFLNYVKNRMFILGMNYLNEHRQKLTAVTEYLQSNLFTGVRKPTAEQIIVSGLKNIIYKRISDKIIFSIDEVRRVPQNDEFQLSTMCQLIDQGNLELQPFQIFTYVFQYVLMNMSSIYSDYTFGVPA